MAKNPVSGFGQKGGDAVQKKPVLEDPAGQNDGKLSGIQGDALFSGHMAEGQKKTAGDLAGRASGGPFRRSCADQGAGIETAQPLLLIKFQGPGAGRSAAPVGKAPGQGQGFQAVS